jgi:hypothetical protein
VASRLEDLVRGHGKGPVQSCPRHKDKRAELVYGGSKGKVLDKRSKNPLMFLYRLLPITVLAFHSPLMHIAQKGMYLKGLR